MEEINDLIEEAKSMLRKLRSLKKRSDESKLNNSKRSIKSNPNFKGWSECAKDCFVRDDSSFMETDEAYEFFSQSVNMNRVQFGRLLKAVYGDGIKKQSNGVNYYKLKINPDAV